eukprot:Seg843.7 transcript_id=Seg843.7/GoldUCD/mRNA.D3Y31 product="hypothetical protein" protein_id=Seg843.7/GoldUCD/D3Y31
MADDDPSQLAKKRVKKAFEDLKRVSAKNASKKVPAKKYCVLCYALPTTGHLQQQRHARERAYYARCQQKQRERSRNPDEEDANATRARRHMMAFLREEDAENEKYKDIEIEDIPARELDEMLCKFFMHARKQNGELYQPDSLTSIRNSLQRVLTDRGSKINLKTSMEFERSRKVLAARRKQLTQLGLGNKPNATRPLEDSEVEKL